MRHPKKTKYGDYATWIKFEVFSNYPVRLILTDNLAKSATDREVPTPDVDADAFCFHTNKGQSYIFLPHDAPEGTVAHEAWHIVHMVLDYVGAKDENEVVAYHLGYLVNKIYEFKKAVKSSRRKNDKSNSRASSKKCS